MSRTPTGIRNRDGLLQLQRMYPLSQTDLWKALTISARTAAWIGPYTGDPNSGLVELTMCAEDGAPTQTVEILNCEPEKDLTVRTGRGDDAWTLSLGLQDVGAGTLLTLRMPIKDAESAASIGPGWEYYLDRLMAAETGADPAEINFAEDYYPAMSEHYNRQFAKA